MATIPALVIRDTDVGDVLEGVEARWKNTVVAELGEEKYTKLPDIQKVRACLVAMLATSAKNVRRTRAEQAARVAVVAVDIT